MYLFCFLFVHRFTFTETFTKTFMALFKAYFWNVRGDTEVFQKSVVVKMQFLKDGWFGLDAFLC